MLDVIFFLSNLILLKVNVPLKLKSSKFYTSFVVFSASFNMSFVDVLSLFGVFVFFTSFYISTLKLTDSMKLPTYPVILH